MWQWPLLWLSPERLRYSQAKDRAAVAPTAKLIVQLKMRNSMIKESTNISQAGPVNLNELKIGNKCEIVAISGERKLRRRLMEMGLLEGSQLRVVKFGPTGDPIQVQVNDYFLSLRRNEAARVVVRITAAEQ